MHDPEIALQLVGALHLFWIARGYVSEGRASVERALAMGNARHHPARTKALQAAVRLLWVQGNYREAHDLAAEWLDLARARGDQAGIAWALHDLGRLAVAVDDPDSTEGEPLLAESLTLFRTLGDEYGIASALNYLGEAARYRGDHERAVTRYEESLPAFRALGERVGVLTVLLNLGAVSRARGESFRAQALYREAIAVARELADPEGIAYGLAGLGGLAVDDGDATAAARLFGATTATCTSLGTVMEPADRAQLERDAAVARNRLGEAAFAQAWKDGHGLSLDQAVAEALAAADVVVGEGSPSAS
jgi:tetratricopeptide (TPR) repeat protein